jgi:phytoene/squalene synthetase
MPIQLENPLAYCREKVAHETSSLHYATVFLSTEDKAFWLGLFTLNQELRQACIKQLEAGLSQIKLGWWRNALSDEQDNTNQHPVIVAISRQFIHSIPTEHWPILIEAVASSCEPKRFNTQHDWDKMLKAELRPWMLLIGKRAKEEDTSSLLEFWVSATQVCQILRIAKYLDDQFQPIPISVLRHYGVTAEQIKQRQHDEKTTALFQALLEEKTQTANNAWNKIPLPLRLFSRPLRALFRMRLAEFYQHKPHFSLFREQKAISPWKKFSIAWTTHVLRR